ncbi:MAG: histidine kinase [Calditrichaeota bacterium]|nr:MAG: histidine kinase [Calditrichota bacterium]
MITGCSKDKLRTISQFCELNDDELIAIASVCQCSNVKKGEILFREGDVADSVYLLIEGFVEIWKNYGSGKRDILAKQNKGNIVGEMAVIDELQRSATVIAGVDMTVYFIPRDEFVSLLRRLPELSFEFMKSISMLVRKSNENFINELQDRNIKLEKTNKKILEMQDELLRKERLSTVGQFSSMILHDLRNPISVIKGYSDILLIKECDAESVRNYAGAIQREAQNLNNLAGEMLDYSRGEIRLNLSVTHLDVLVDEVFTVIKRKMLGDKIVLSKEVYFHDPVLIDNDRFFRVLVNLCDNSRKALYNGGEIKVIISKEDHQFVIMVIDDGDGIDKDKLEKIFDPFTSFSRAGGTGLGMVIVKNIVEAHHGQIKVSSEVHLGTTVTIKLPFNN